MPSAAEMAVEACPAVKASHSLIRNAGEAADAALLAQTCRAGAAKRPVSFLWA